MIKQRSSTGKRLVSPDITVHAVRYMHNEDGNVNYVVSGCVSYPRERTILSMVVLTEFVATLQSSKRATSFEVTYFG